MGTGNRDRQPGQAVSHFLATGSTDRQEDRQQGRQHGDTTVTKKQGTRDKQVTTGTGHRDRLYRAQDKRIRKPRGWTL
jgi:hypothetical protein